MDSVDFTIVGFQDGTVSLISSSWLCGDNQCYWPPKDLKKLAAAHAIVQDSWILYDCRIIGTAGKINNDLQ